MSEALVYQRGMATLDAELASTYRASPWVYEMMATGTREVAHLSFAVAVLETEMTSPDDRQRANTPTNLRSRVGVRLVARIRPDGTRADVAAAYAAGVLARAALIRQAEGVQAAQGAQSWRWIRTTTSVVGDGTHLLIEQVYTVHHLVPTI